VRTSSHLDEVREHLVDLDVVERHRGQVFWHSDNQMMGSRHRPQSPENLVNECGHVIPAFVRSQAATFDARQVQQITHDPIQPLRLFDNGVCKILPLLVRPHHVVLLQAAGGRHDRR
jgi:hypothetical protein